MQVGDIMSDTDDLDNLNLNEDIRLNKESILYVPNPEPDLKYDTTGEVKNNGKTAEQEDNTDKVDKLKDAGEAILAATAYMPKNISLLVENTVVEAIKNIEEPGYNPDGNKVPENEYTDDTKKEDKDVGPSIYEDENNDIEVPDFFPPAPNYELIVTEFKPLYQIASDIYTSDMYDVKQYFVKKLQECMSKYFSQMVRIKNECGVSDITKLLDDFDPTATKVNDSNLVHLSDFITRSQIIRDQNTRLFNKTHNTNETLYHLRACLAAYTQRARYYKAAYGKDTSTFLSTKSNTLLLESRQQYDKNYKNAVYNLYKYLNSSVIIINKSLQASLKEAEAKGQLFKNGVNVFLTNKVEPSPIAAIMDNTTEVASKTDAGKK